MSEYPGIYRAICASTADDTIQAYIPQVFGDNRIPITNRTGALPKAGAKGWVQFEAAMASLPVWVSSSGSSNETAVAQDDSVFITEMNATLAMFSLIVGAGGAFNGVPPILSTNALPHSFVGKHVRMSTLITQTSGECSYVYNADIEDPDNPGVMIRPEDEAFPWPSDARISLPLRMSSPAVPGISDGSGTEIRGTWDLSHPAGYVDWAVFTEVTGVFRPVSSLVGIYVDPELFTGDVEDIISHVPPPTYPDASPSLQGPPVFPLMLLRFERLD